jgi:phenylalanyl-tRNA synthetase beta chain
VPPRRPRPDGDRDARPHRPDDHAALGIDAADPATIRIVNPLSLDHSVMRRSLLPGLLRVIRDNERQRREDFALFEVGPAHAIGDAGPAERQWLAVAMAGRAVPASWASQPRMPTSRT